MTWVVWCTVREKQSLTYDDSDDSDDATGRKQ